jgi:hypothetical protein
VPVTATITKEQRDGLYELVRHHLYSIEDLWIAFGRSRDYATAERLALEFGEDFRLLADIGWAADDDRESFELTIPPLDLDGIAPAPPRRSRESPGRVGHRARGKRRRRQDRRALPSWARRLRESPCRPRSAEGEAS